MYFLLTFDKKIVNIYIYKVHWQKEIIKWLIINYVN